MTGSQTSNSRGGEGACTLTARVIAEIVGGELRGDASTEVDSVAPLSRAKRSQLSFLADRRYVTALEASEAGVILVSPDLADAPGDVPARIVVAKPPAAMLELLPRLYPRSYHLPGVHPSARIGNGASLGNGVRLDEYAVVGKVQQSETAPGSERTASSVMACRSARIAACSPMSRSTAEQRLAHA